jgi:hypothetical protein
LERLWRICGFPADDIFWNQPMSRIAWETINLTLRRGTFMSMLAAVVQDRQGHRGYAELSAVLEGLKKEVDEREARKAGSQ